MVKANLYRLNFGDPTILNLDNKTWNPEYCIINENYDDKWSKRNLPALSVPLRCVVLNSHCYSLPCHYGITSPSPAP
jgi:hypothetical protein